jgi:hypothetical protein
MKTLIALTVLATSLVAADCTLELRGSNTTYRYADALCGLSRHWVTEASLVGTEGANELSTGLGYQFKPIVSLTLIPVLYGVIDKEGNQRGAKVGLIVGFEKNKYKASGYLARYQRIAGTVANYFVLDTLDVTRSVSKHWEAGTSLGFLRQTGKWNPQYGGMVKLNDKAGYTAVSYRFGIRELRVSRVFAIKR